ncbi:MAG: hypothetical protein WDO73_38075 [Ignavibacteriota bacterium]
MVLHGQERVSGTALVDFGKLRRAQGYEPGWLMSKLLDGERAVSATAHIRTGDGKVTVDVERASISGIEIDGKTLDFVIQNFILPFYPEAMVGRPVPMGYHIERLQLAPAGIGRDDRAIVYRVARSSGSADCSSTLRLRMGWTMAHRANGISHRRESA